MLLLLLCGIVDIYFSWEFIAQCKRKRALAVKRKFSESIPLTVHRVSPGAWKIQHPKFQICGLTCIQNKHTHTHTHTQRVPYAGFFLGGGGGGGNIYM